MRRLILFLCLLMMLAACGGSPSRPASAPAMELATVEQFTAALATAANTHNTTIRFTADITSTRTLPVQGVGTTVDLDGHTFAYNGHYQGPGTTSGCGLNVTPTLGDPVAIDGSTNVILCNVDGNVRAINIALGGDTKSWFAEPAPIQYADEPRRDTYTLQRAILTRAENITLKNGKIVCLDPQAFRGAYVEYARNVTFQNITFAYPVAIIPNLETGATRASGITFIDCDLGGHNLAFNSSYNVTVKGCTHGDITFEERCQNALVQGCNVTFLRVNDATCAGMTITGNTFTNPDANFGCIVLGGLSGTNAISGNTLAGCGVMWSGFLAKGTTLAVNGNTGFDFFRYGGTPAGASITETANTWTNRKAAP